MILLALETCGEYTSVALWQDDESLERHIESPARHTEVLLPLCEELRALGGIRLAQLDGVAFGAGPGAFTGVRVAASAAQGIALAHDLPLLPISSLAALAYGGWRTTGLRHQLALLDARRNEVYWGFYAKCDNTAGLIALTADQLTSSSGVIPPVQTPFGAVGRGCEVLTPEDRSRLAPAVMAPAEYFFPHARDVAALAALELRAGRGRTAEEAQPVYLRAALQP